MENRKPSFMRVLYHLLTANRLAGTERRKSSFLHSIAIFVSIALVGFGLLMLLEAVLTPWARSLTGGPILVGEWYGEMQTPTGRKQVVHITIESPGYGCNNCPDITGTAQSCDGQGSLQKYEIWGDPENWRGTKFQMKTRKMTEQPLELRLGELEGEWNGDTVRLTTTLRSDTYNYSISTQRDETGKEITRMVGAHPDTLSPVAFTLRRGGEQDFLAVCGRLGIPSRLTNR